MNTVVVVMESWAYAFDNTLSPARCAEDAVRRYVADDGAPDGEYTAFVSSPSQSLRAVVRVQGAGTDAPTCTALSCVEGLLTDPEMEELTHLRERVW